MITVSMNYELYNGDCLKWLPNIASESIDMILCDLPYGITRAKWDNVIDPVKLWREYKRIIKPNGCIALFALYPFSIDLIEPARRLFRYEWVWVKHMPVGFLNANRMPLRAHENILIFYKHLPTYNPQKWQAKPYTRTKCNVQSTLLGAYGINSSQSLDGSRYPIDVIRFNNDLPVSERTHPTEKPVELLEYLIRTYTNPGDTVLDNAMGTGSTGVAAMNLDRRFEGAELNTDFFDIAYKRIQTAGERRGNGTI